MRGYKWLDNVKMAMNLELREISLMAQLAEQLPSAEMRMEILEKICEEAHEASFWNTVYACYCEEEYGPGYGPGCGPGYGYGPDCPYGPGSGYGPGPGYGSGPGYGPGYGPDCPGYGPGYGPDCPGYGPGIYKAEEEKAQEDMKEDKVEEENKDKK